MKFLKACLLCVIILVSGCVFDDDSSKEKKDPTEPPAAPTGLTADVSVPYTITLHWQDNAGNEQGYVLGGITLPANTTQWTFSDLDQPYYTYELYAFNDAGISSSVRSEEIKVTWEYPVWYQLNIINTESNGTSDSQPPNGFVCVYEDSVAISFTCTVGGKERIVDIYSKRPYPFLTLTRDELWFTQYFENDNYEQNRCSIWASRVESQDDIEY